MFIGGIGDGKGGTGVYKLVNGKLQKVSDKARVIYKSNTPNPKANGHDISPDAAKYLAYKNLDARGKLNEVNDWKPFLKKYKESGQPML